MERKLYTVVNFNMLHAILSNRRIGSEKNRFWLIAVILSLSTNYAFSQGDYIATDSTLSSGIKLMEGTARDNAQFIRLIKKHRVIKYLPNSIPKMDSKIALTVKKPQKVRKK